jgi:hypothetical protein
MAPSLGAHPTLPTDYTHMPQIEEMALFNRTLDDFIREKVETDAAA